MIGDEDDVAIAAVTAAELLVGVERAEDRHRPRRAGFVADVLESVVLVPTTSGWLALMPPFSPMPSEREVHAALMI